MLHETAIEVNNYNETGMKGSRMIEQKIGSFAALPKGWDYGNGGPLPQETLDAAFEWNRYLRNRGFWDIDAFPGSDGEVVVAAGYGDHYLEIIIEPDAAVSIAYDRKGKQELYIPNKPPANAVQELISALRERGWLISPSASDIPRPENTDNREHKGNSQGESGESIVNGT